MNIINARVKLLIGTEEEVRAGLIVRQKGYATDTKKWIVRTGIDTYETLDKFSETLTIALTEPSTESVSGTAVTQQDANREFVSKNSRQDEQIQQNTDSISALASASMALESTTPFSIGDSETNRTRWDFDILTPSDTPSVLDADEVTNTIFYKEQGRRYFTDAILKVANSANSDASFWINAYNDADDLPIGAPVKVDVPGVSGGGVFDIPLKVDITYGLTWLTDK